MQSKIQSPVAASNPFLDGGPTSIHCVQSAIDLFTSNPRMPASRPAKASEDLLQLNPFADAYTQNQPTSLSFQQLNAWIPNGNSKCRLLQFFL